MAIRCCICGRPVEIPKRDLKRRGNLVTVADEPFYFHRDRPRCRTAVQRMQAVLIHKQLERQAEDEAVRQRL